MLCSHNLPAIAATVTAMFLAAPLMAPVPPGSTGVILITGSDGDTFHGHTPYATAVRDFLKGNSAMDVLVLGDASATGAFSAAVGGVDITAVSSLAEVNLSDFSALYLLSNSNNGPGCCQADVALILGFEAAIQAFIASGGSLGIQDYTGDAGFDPLLGTVGGANGEVFGFGGGLGGPSDYDDEAVTPDGVAAGFMNYPPLGAWGHQGFRMSFFSTLGFVSLIDAPAYGPDVSGVMAKEGSVDCNGNGIPDDEDIAGGTSQDCNGNGVPDECDIDDGTSQDCNGNDVPDECDIADGTSQDCNGNGIPDECDIASGTSTDHDGNGIPDECEGDADFEDPQEFEAVGNPNIEAVGDLDGDGDADIVIAVPGTDSSVNGVIQVFINQGNDAAGDWIGLVANDPVIVGREPTGVAVGLFDADLHVDVAVTNAGDNTLSILYNKGFGDGSLFDPVNLAVGNRPSAVVAADFNLDTFVDLAVTNELDGNVMLILNGDFPPPPPLGGGGGAAAAGGFSTFPIGGDGFSLISDDFDGNKRPDMAGTARAAGLTGPTGVVFVLLGLGDGTFEPVTLIPVGSNPLDLSSADLQRDGAVDIVVANAGDGTVSILINQLDGTFVADSTIAVGGTPVSIDAVELSGDSDPDLAVVAIDPEIGPAIQVLQNALGLGTELVFEDPKPFSVDADPNFVLSADLNNDGAADLVTVNADDGETGGSVTAILGDPSPIAFRARLDIRPGGCPNPLNRKSRGVLPVALLGSDVFDVSSVDLTTLRLERAAGIGGSVAPLQGPPGPSSVIEDVATPFDGPGAPGCDCHDLAGDGTVDLSMKFGLAEVVQQLELDLLSGGDEVQLVLSGLLLDGTPFAASDCIRIVPATDIDGDGVVGAADLIMLLGAWGPCAADQECQADLDEDGTVSISDLLTLLANWG